MRSYPPRDDIRPHSPPAPRHERPTSARRERENECVVAVQIAYCGFSGSRAGLGTRDGGFADSPVCLAAWLIDHGDGHSEPAAAISAALRRPTRGQESRLLPGRSVPASCDLVVVDQFGIRPLCPTPRGLIEIAVKTIPSATPGGMPDYFGLGNRAPNRRRPDRLLRLFVQAG
jgi:hypothetical protein